MQVYNRPANHFVAEFMGFDNFFPGTVKAVDSGEMLVEAEGVELSLRRGDQEFKVGEEVEVAIRAHHIKLGAGDHPGRNFLKGRVEALLYQGDRTLYFVELDSGRKASVVCEGPPVKQRGEMVSLYISPEKATLIKL